MKKRNRFNFVSSLLILAMLLIAACSGSKTTPDRSQGEEPLNEQKKLIEKNISDENKKVEMMKILDELNSEMEKFYNYYTKHQNNMTKLHMSYGTSAEDFEEARNQFIPNYKKFLAAVISKRMELRDLATPEEWSTISQITKTFIPPKDYREK